MQLGIVDNQLTDVCDHHIPSHVVRSHDNSLYPVWQLLLPGDLRTWAPRHITKEAGCFTDIYRLVGRAADDDGWLRFCGRWDSRLEGGSGRTKSGRLG